MMAGLRVQLQTYLQHTSQQIPDTYISKVYERLYIVPFNVRNHLCHSYWTAFQGPVHLCGINASRLIRIST